MWVRKAPSTTPKPLVVWDFDWSLVDENTDTYVIERCDPSQRTWEAGRQMLACGERGWTELMDWALGELHHSGVTSENIREVLESVPILDAALKAVSVAREAGATQNILSDANSVYISTILSKHNISDSFGQVVTNPATADADGRLRVRAHQQGEPHQCPHCPPNLCKGAVLQRWLDGCPGCTCVYVGDGQGDFCPATRLRTGDVLIARREPHDGLLRACRASPASVVAQVVEWGGREDELGLELLDGMRRAVQWPASLP
jgi:pyridoxal phosphate phosphatase PHOSPHO2